jgi:hypothetical protein
MRIVVCITVVFGGEEVLSDGGHTRGGCGQEGGEVGCHCGVGASRRRGLVVVGSGLRYLWSIPGMQSIVATREIAN